MSLEIALIVATVAGVLIWQVCAWFFKPGVAVTVQKTTNANEQPEVVTVSANVWRLSNPDALFRVISDAADAAWARMFHVNMTILERNKELAAEMERRKGEQEAWKSRASRRQRRHIAKALGIPLRDLTQADIDRYVAPQAENPSLEPAGSA